MSDENSGTKSNDGGIHTVSVSNTISLRECVEILSYPDENSVCESDGVLNSELQVSLIIPYTSTRVITQSGVALQHSSLLSGVKHSRPLSPSHIYHDRREGGKDKNKLKRLKIKVDKKG